MAAPPTLTPPPPPAPPSAAPAGQRHCGPEEGAAGDDAALRDGEFSAQEVRGAEEAPPAPSADLPVPEPGLGSPGGVGGSGEVRRGQEKSGRSTNTDPFSCYLSVYESILINLI